MKPCNNAMCQLIGSHVLDCPAYENLERPAQVPSIGGDESGRRSNVLTIRVGPELFSFSDERDWINHASSRFNEYFDCGQSDTASICIDGRGRVCTLGKHFARATREDAYPIRVYEIEVSK